MAPVGISMRGMFPARIWNFKGAYVVWFMTGVSCSACLYTCYHYIKNSPDFAWRAEMRGDEDQQNQFLYDRARSTIENNFFRKLASSRDKEESHASAGKDTRIFR